MTRRLLPVLLALLAIGPFAAGCGDDDSDSSASDTTTAATTTEDTTTDTGGSTSPAVQQAVDGCKQTVSSIGSALSSDAKDKLDGLCDDLATKSPDELEQSARDVCEQIVQEAVPAGSAQDQAVTQCQSIKVSP